MRTRRGPYGGMRGAWLVLALWPWALRPAAGANFADSSLAAAVAEAADTASESLTQSDLLALTQLLARDRGITDVTGIEQLANLQVLDLSGNQIRDLAPLSALTHLVYLDLQGNDVTDLAPLSGLAELELLLLNGNQVRDISSLLELEQLATVELLDNPLDPATAPGYVATLQSRGVEIFWSQVPTAPDSPRWEFLGPEAPEPRAVRVRDFAITGADPELMYAAIGERIKRSRDGGASWEDFASRGYDGRASADPQDPLVAYVYGEWGSYSSADMLDLRTFDGGASWDTLSIPGPGNLLAVDAVVPGRVYATHVVQDSTTYVCEWALLVSDDYGDSWHRALEVEGKNYGLFVWSHPAWPEVVYCGYRTRVSIPGYTVFRSQDGGVTFEPWPVWRDMIVVVPDPSAPDALYGANVSGLWHSADGGQSWERLGEMPRRNVDFLAIHPVMPTTMWTGTHVQGELWQSQDGGLTWVHRGMARVRDESIVMHPRDPRHAYLLSGQGLYVTGDAGATWEPVSFQTRDIEVWSLTVDAESLVYAACMPDQSLRLRGAHGEGWEDLQYSVRSSTDPPLGLLWADPRHSGVVYAFDRREGWIRSADYGASWHRLEMSGLGGRQWPRLRVTASTEGSQVCYAVDAADSALYRSADNGLTWHRVVGDAETFALDPSTPGRIVVSRATDQSLRLTEDGGITWDMVGTPPSGEDVLQLAIHLRRPERVFVACRSSLYGLSLADGTWDRLLASERPRKRRWVQFGFDAADADDVCVLWEEGLWQSGDGGRTWESLVDAPGAPTDILDMAVDPRDPRTVYVGTPKGVYRLERPRVATVVTAAEGQAVPQAFAVHPNYPNPFNSQTAIRYAVPAPGPVELAVYNVLGQRITVLVTEERLAGMHRVLWGGRDASGRPAASGVYLCRLSAGGLVAVRRMLLLR